MTANSTVRATTMTPRALPIWARGEAISGPVPVAAAKARPAGGISPASRATMFVAFVSASSVSVPRTGMTWPSLSGPTLSPSTPRNVISPASDTVTTTPETASTRTRASRAIRPRSCSRSSPSRTAWVSAPIARRSRSTRREDRADCRPMRSPRRDRQCTGRAKRLRASVSPASASAATARSSSLPGRGCERSGRWARRAGRSPRRRALRSSPARRRGRRPRD